MQFSMRNSGKEKVVREICRKGSGTREEVNG